MTAVLEAGQVEAPPEYDEVSTLASWPSRAGAVVVDFIVGLAVVATLALLELSATAYRHLWWCAIVVAALVILAILVNRLLAPAAMGWTLGRALFGIAVVRPDGTRPGPLRLLVRDLAHLLDTLALFLGWLWPLWDSRNRTFADLLLRTEVRRVDPPAADMRRIVGAFVAAAVVIAAAASGLTYLTVYRHEQAADAARAEVADQGPRIVEQILTYNAGTMKDDFTHAQTLVTDSYRDQLVKEQQVVAKKAAASNEYWAVTSSVLPGTTADTAKMLVFLQGQRQAQQQDVKFITATALVSFEKSRGGTWRVSDLTVLAQPALPKGGK